MTVHRQPDALQPWLPMMLQVEFTSRCSLRCRMCPLTTGTSSSSASPGPMEDVIFDELLPIARRCGRVLLAGYGEPLTNRQCIPMLRVLNGEGIEIAMATNGLALSPAVSRQLVALEHLRHINVSIDSPDADVYRQLRGAEVGRALQGLRNLMAAIDDPERVTVSSVALRATLPTLVAFPGLLAQMGVRRFILQEAMDYNDYAQQQGLVDQVQLAGLLEAIEASCVAHGLSFELSAPDRSRADVEDPSGAVERFYGSGGWDERFTRQCDIPWNVPFIDKDGRVFPCCFAAAANEYQLGQLGAQTFDEIWTGPSFQEFRHDIVDGRTTPEICRRCTAAPLGQHQFRTWAASVLSGSATVTDDGNATVSVAVRNDGDRAWTAADFVHIGAAQPRDSGSPLAHPAWLSANRAATFRQPTVPPGATAAFEFPVVVPQGPAVSALFEIVADGVCWLPNTAFAVNLPSHSSPPLKIALRGLQRQRGPVSRTCRRAVPTPLLRWFARMAD